MASSKWINFLVFLRRFEDEETESGREKKERENVRKENLVAKETRPMFEREGERITV
jgi:hypothetical protein